MKGWNNVYRNELYSVDDNTDLDSMTVSFTKLNQAQTTRGHAHPAEEVYIFHTGKGIMRIEDTDYLAKPGDVFTVSPNQHHKVINNSTKNKLTFYCVFEGNRLKKVYDESI